MCREMVYRRGGGRRRCFDMNELRAQSGGGELRQERIVFIFCKRKGDKGREDGSNTRKTLAATAWTLAMRSRNTFCLSLGTAARRAAFSSSLSSARSLNAITPKPSSTAVTLATTGGKKRPDSATHAATSEDACHSGSGERTRAKAL